MIYWLGMTKTSASANTSPKGSTASHAHAAGDYASNPSGIVVGLTVSMSWQLALVVLLPLVGGHFIDDRLRPNGTPIFTLTGLLLAIAGMVMVVRRTVKELNKYMSKVPGDKHE